MKRVMIIGADSYIGDSFAAYAKNRLIIDIVDSYEGWKAASYDEYDSILLVAGLAHQKHKKEAYFAINRDLPIVISMKAKAGGVGQVIFLSSMAVYGKIQGEITTGTIPKPCDYYGLSKLQAEEALTQTMKDKLCIVRPPMVYGSGCPGNFGKLVRLIKRAPIFPKINNQRSMIFIDNLCSFLLHSIENSTTGIYLPQNAEYVNTTVLAHTISEQFGRKLRTTRLFNPLIFVLMRFIPYIAKLFGNLYYSKNEDVILPPTETELPISTVVPVFPSIYNEVSFEESIVATIQPLQIMSNK